MIDWISVWREKLGTSLWPVPLLMLLVTGVLYTVLREADGQLSAERALRSWVLYSGSGDDARNLLSTLVSAIIGMAAVVFSITIVALTLAANQFSSRLVRIYTGDIRTKLALGTFMSTIVYCLLALRAVQKDMPAADVPHLTVTAGLVLGLTCIIWLAFFLHQVAHSIMADEVIRRTARELTHSIYKLPPIERVEWIEPPTVSDLPERFAERAAIVHSSREGYVQAIEYEALLALARRHDLVIELDFRAGAYLAREGRLAAVYPQERVTEETIRAIQDAVLIGEHRTPTQDLEFSTRHLVDIAIRALSPGINDANTALVVIDHLRGALSHLFSRALPPAVYRDERGVVRVVGKYNGYTGVLDAAFHQIRQAAASQPAVVINLLSAFGRMAEHVRVAEQRDALAKHAELVARAGLRDVLDESDRADIERAIAAAGEKIREVRVGPVPLREAVAEETVRQRAGSSGR